MEAKPSEKQMDSSTSYRNHFFEFKNILNSIEFCFNKSKEQFIFRQFNQSIDYLLNQSLDPSLDKCLVQISLKLISGSLRRQQRITKIQNKIQEKVSEFVDNCLKQMFATKDMNQLERQQRRQLSLTSLLTETDISYFTITLMETIVRKMAEIIESNVQNEATIDPKDIENTYFVLKCIEDILNKWLNEEIIDLIGDRSHPNWMLDTIYKNNFIKYITKLKDIYSDIQILVIHSKRSLPVLNCLVFEIQIRLKELCDRFQIHLKKLLISR